MAGGTWDPISLPVRPGLYANFVEAADMQIKNGTYGTVAIILPTVSGTAEAGKIIKVEALEVNEVLGETEGAPVKRIFNGGAKEVVVYVLPEDTTEITAEVLAELDTHKFDVFVFADAVEASVQDIAVDWLKDNRENGKPFMMVLGAASDETDNDPAVGNARSVRVKDEAIVNVVNSVEGLTTTEQAQIIAGMVAGTPINKSITYDVVDGADLEKRLSHTKTVEALEAGSLVLTHDGEKIKIESAVTTDGKIRPIRARYAILNDLMKTAADNYIGKLDNNEDGQIALMSAMKAYLERMEMNNVLIAPKVELDPLRPSVGDKVFLVVSYQEVDSMERIFLTVNV